MSVKLYATRDNNNEGIKAEASGDIQKAIELYEENIREGYPATHSYERLMIIYKKIRKLTDEIRVTNKAIEVFSEENKLRFKSALSMPENKEYLVDIKTGMLTGKTVRDKYGNVIFNPYPVLQYVSRKNKLLKIQNKENRS